MPPICKTKHPVSRYKVRANTRQRAISWIKEGNGFTVGSDLEAFDELARDLRQPHGLGQFACVVDRWVYSPRLCFALDGQT